MEIKLSTLKKQEYLYPRDLKANTMYWIVQYDHLIFIPMNNGGGSGVVIDTKEDTVYPVKHQWSSGRKYIQVAKSFSVTLIQDLREYKPSDLEEI